MPDFSPTSPKLTVKEKIKQSFASIFRPPSPTDVEKSSKPTSPTSSRGSPKETSSTSSRSPPIDLSPASSPRISVLKELANKPSESVLERNELAQSLEALGKSDTEGVSNPNEGLAAICEKLIGDNAGVDKKTVLSELLNKLESMGISKNTGGDAKKMQERSLFIGILSKVLGPENTNELVSLALKKEVNSLVLVKNEDGVEVPKEKINVDARFRQANMAVSLYVGLVESSMPEIAAGGSVMNKCASTYQRNRIY